MAADGASCRLAVSTQDRGKTSWRRERRSAYWEGGSPSSLRPAEARAGRRWRRPERPETLRARGGRRSRRRGHRSRQWRAGRLLKRPPQWQAPPPQRGGRLPKRRGDLGGVAGLQVRGGGGLISRREATFYSNKPFKKARPFSSLVILMRVKWKLSTISTTFLEQIICTIHQEFHSYHRLTVSCLRFWDEKEKTFFFRFCDGTIFNQFIWKKKIKPNSFSSKDLMCDRKFFAEKHVDVSAQKKFASLSLTLFYFLGLGIVALHAMFPQP